MPTVYLTASTPWIIRNFFHTGVVSRFAEIADVVVFTTPHMREGLVRDGFDRIVEIHTLENRPEPLPWKISRQLRKKLYMEMRGAETEALWEKFGSRTMAQRLVGRAVAASADLLAGARTFALLDRGDLLVNRSPAFRAMFRSRRPSVLFATGVNSQFEESISRSARAAGVPIVYMPSGWDHLSTKVVLSDVYDAVLTWTEIQREEAITTYPWLSAENVKTVGIPQFDAYASGTPMSIAEWAAQYGLDPARKTLVYFSMPQVRHSDQHLILEAAAEEIRVGGRLPRDLQILIKCHPFDDNSVYEPLVSRYSNVGIQRTTLAPGADPLTWLPSPGEIESMRDTLSHADVTVNVYSTSTIEAALFDKPIVHIAYDVRPLKNGRIPCREYYNFTHFRPVVAYGASDLAYNQEELYTFVSQALADPSRHRKERRTLAAALGGPNDGKSGDRVINAVMQAVSP